MKVKNLFLSTIFIVITNIFCNDITNLIEMSRKRSFIDNPTILDKMLSIFHNQFLNTDNIIDIDQLEVGTQILILGYTYFYDVTEIIHEDFFCLTLNKKHQVAGKQYVRVMKCYNILRHPVLNLFRSLDEANMGAWTIIHNYELWYAEKL